jgi:hypothetical protein
MQIGEPQRTIVVEPLASPLPDDGDGVDSEPIATPEPEPSEAQVR